MTDEMRNETEGLTETGVAADAATVPTGPVQDGAPAALTGTALPEETAARAAWLGEHAAELAKWLTVLFWLSVLALVRSGLEDTFKLPEKIALMGPLLSAVGYGITVVRICAAWRLRRAERCFGTLALVNGVSLAVLFVSGRMLDGVDAAGFVEGLSKASSVVLAAAGLALLLGLYAAVCYMEMTAYGRVARYVDETLAVKWHRLRGWAVGATAVTFAAGDLLALCAGDPFAVLFRWSTFMLFLMAAGTIGMVVCSVLELVFLYRTAKRFRAAALGAPAEGAENENAS